MPARIVVYVLADKEQFSAAMASCAVEGRAMGDTLSMSSAQTAEKMGASFESAAHGLAAIFLKIGQYGTSMGIPFSSTFTKMGQSLNTAEASGKGFMATMTDVGGITFAVGGIVAVALGVEGVKAANAFDGALSITNTAIRNTGESVSAFAPTLQKLEQTMVGAGHTTTDTVTAFGKLTAATGSTSKSMSYMSLIANMAAFHHESLTAAVGELLPILAGGTRSMSSWGINLNIGSARLETITQATEGLAKAQLASNAVQSQVNAGLVTGITASNDQAKAALVLKDAHIALNLATSSTATVIKKLTDVTAGASDAFGKTFPGHVDILKAKFNEFEVSAGHLVQGGLKVLETALIDVMNVLAPFKAVVEAVGVVIGLYLTASMIAFAGTMVSKVWTSTSTSIEKMLHLGGAAKTASVEVETSNKTIATSSTTTSSTVVASNDEMMASYEAFAARVATATGEVGAASTAETDLVVANDARQVVANRSVAESFTAMLGPIGLAAAAAGFIGGEAFHLWGDQQIAHNKAKVQGGTDEISLMDQAAADKRSGNVTAYNAATLALRQQGSINSVLGLGVSAAMIAAEIKGEAGLAFGSQANTNAAARAQGDWSAHRGGYEAPRTGGAGNTEISAIDSPLYKSANALINTYQQQIQAGTISSLTTETDPAAKAAMNVQTAELVATHNTNLQYLVTDLKTEWAAKLTTLNALIVNQEQVKNASLIQMQAGYLNDTVTIMKDMASAVVSAITAASTIATDRASAQASAITDQGKIVSDTLAERGLYGLNLVVAKMTVNSDKITSGWDARIAADQTRVDTVAQQGTAAIAAVQANVDQLARTMNVSVARAQTIVNMAAESGASVQKLAASGLTLAQAQAAMSAARTNQALTAAQDASSIATARIQAVLSQAQNSAKVAEAQQQSLIAIEQARASTEFAGSGVHIQITGISPTDSAAVAAAISWHLRTKVPA